MAFEMIMHVTEQKGIGMNNDPVVDIRDLRKTYREGFFGAKFEALRGVTLQVFPGEVFGLLGPNGAGKTTMIKILLGILHPTSGQATVLNFPAGSKNARKRIGYLPENLVFPRHLTGQGALYFYARLNQVPEKDIRAKEGELFELVGLKGRDREPVRKYSKGMRQRLGLAQAMIHDPDILIMDEPTDGLDPLGRSQIRSVIEQLKARGKTVFLNSHILQEVELVCDRVAILAQGQLRGLGTTKELAARFHQNLSILVTFVLQGDEQKIRSVLSQRMLKSFDVARNPMTGDKNEFTAQIEVLKQSEIDETVDQLRDVDASIIRLEPFRASLEDVFIKALDNGTSPNQMEPA